MRGALVAGEVLTTATADAEGAARIEENAETAASAQQAPQDPDRDGPDARDAAAASHARASGQAGPPGPPGSPSRVGVAPTCRPARCRRSPPPGQARSPAGVRHEPSTRTADEDHPRASPEGGRPPGRARLRRRRALAQGPEAQVGRPVHHPSARGRHDPGRARHEHRDDLRRPAPRHRRGHRLHPGRAPQRLRRGRLRPRRRRHQARQGQVRRLGRGRDRPQDGRRDVPRHPRAGHQARRPPAQHAHAALHAAGQAGAQVPRDARDLRPARAPAGHEHGQVGARGPRVRHPLPEALRRDRAARLPAVAAARPAAAGGHHRPVAPTCTRPGSRARSAAAPSTTTRSTRR